jgi:hypothetical protein
MLISSTSHARPAVSPFRSRIFGRLDYGSATMARRGSVLKPGHISRSLVERAGAKSLIKPAPRCRPGGH